MIDQPGIIGAEAEHLAMQFHHFTIQYEPSGSRKRLPA